MRSRTPWAQLPSPPVPRVVAQVPATPDVQLKVDVVGSGIKRYLEDQAQPVTIMTSRRHQAQRRSEHGIRADQKISATAGTGATFGAQLAGQSTYGSSGVSLRGLGADANPGSARRDAIDAVRPGDKYRRHINQIPISAIDRVEVLLDGASSIYGSDAEAGVINSACAGITLGRRPATSSTGPRAAAAAAGPTISGQA